MFYMTRSWLDHMRDVTHSHVWCDSFICERRDSLWLWHGSFTCFTWLVRDSIICVTWLIHMCNVKTWICNMTHWCVLCDSFTCAMWLFHMWHDSLIYVTWLFHMWHDSFICVTWLIHSCDMTRSHVSHMSRLYVQHDPFTFMTRLFHSQVWYDSFTCVTWLFHMCDMTLSHVWHDSFTCVTWLFHMCDMTHLWIELPDVVEVEFLEAWRDAILSKTLWHGICACIEIETGCVYVRIKREV